MAAKLGQRVVLQDPTTGVPYAATGVAGGPAVTVANGADVAQGTTTDAASASTVIGLLKALKGALASPATPVACPASGTTTAKGSAGTLYGLVATGTGTAGTVALADGSTTLFTASIPAVAGLYPLPIPALGAAFGTSIKVTTSGTGVTALAFIL